MLAVSSPGFVVFAGLLVGLWYRLQPKKRTRYLRVASALFYLSLDWQGM